MLSWLRCHLHNSNSFQGFHSVRTLKRMDQNLRFPSGKETDEQWLVFFLKYWWLFIPRLNNTLMFLAWGTLFCFSMRWWIICYFTKKYCVIKSCHDGFDCGVSCESFNVYYECSSKWWYCHLRHISKGRNEHSH